MERKKWDTGSERTSLTERKIELLESIEFIWAQNHKGEIGWERRFQEIRKFKRKQGHCNVPTKSAENRALGRWVSTQRTMYKNYMKGFVGKSLTREEQERRIFLLLKEGFLFSMIPNGHGGGDPQEALSDEGDDSGGVGFSKEASSPRSVSEVETKGSSNDDALHHTNVADAATTSASPVPVPSSKLAPDSRKEDEKAETNGERNVFDSAQQTLDSEETKAAEKNVAKEAMPLSPTLQPKEKVLKPEEEATETSPPPVSSIAQVSVTTTPATTPSVSTAASPDRSPEVIVSSGDDERDCIDGKAATTTISEKKNKTKNGVDDDIIDTMPVATSLKAKSDINRLPCTGTTQSNLPSTSAEEKSGVPKRAALSGRPNAFESDASTTARPNTLLESNNNRASSPTTNDDALKRTKKESALLSETERTKPSNAGNDDRILHETTPPLITSEGLRIIVTMKNYKDAGAIAKEYSRSSRDGGASENSSSFSMPSSSSPSRRSVRARKPSARQMEAEKSPLTMD